MKIIQLIFSLTSAGAERLVVNLCNELSKNNEVILITFVAENATSTFYKPLLNNSIRYINLGCTSGLSLRAVFKTIVIFIKEKPSVVHAHLNTVLYCMLPSLFIKCKFIHTLHSIAPKTVGFAGQKILNKWFYKFKRIIPVAISKECAASFTDFYKLNGISIVDNGVPEAHQSADFNKVKSELAQVPNFEKSKKFIHIARFGAVKNQEVLMAVFTKLIAAQHQVCLFIIGDGFEPLKSVHSANSGIYFLGPKQNPLDYLQLSNCLILTSLWEGMPMCALESLSCGIPIVSTPAGGMIDVIQNNINGLLSAAFDEASIKTAVLQMVSKLDTLAFNKQQIINIYNSKYSITACCNKYLAIYNTIV